jgi:5-methylcytosine-specific restriction endonuclease McrA
MTDKEAKHFYNSKEWKEKRIDILIRDRNECQDCIVRIRKAVEEGIRLTPEDRKVRRATEVHHIQELKEHPELALDDDNLIGLCHTCHDIRHNRHTLVRRKRKKRLTEERW